MGFSIWIGARWGGLDAGGKGVIIPYRAAVVCDHGPSHPMPGRGTLGFHLPRGRVLVFERGGGRFGDGSVCASGGWMTI